MSLTMMVGAGALVLLLAALLVLKRRRASAEAEDNSTHAPAAGRDSADAEQDEDWRAPGVVDRAAMLVRGRGASIALLRGGVDEIRIQRDGDGVCLANDHNSVYGGRPNWDHIAELTRAMGKAERCFPGADLSGRLRYIDKTVPVEYSPRLVADLEDDTAPDPRETTATG